MRTTLRSAWGSMQALVALLLCAFWAFAGSALAAGVIEARRNTFIYEKPDRTSGRVHAVNTADQSPYLLRLVTAEKRNGYYHVVVPGTNKKGWIYKTYVRRYANQHPKQTKYSRSLWQHWVDEDGNCRDTRQEVLLRDATGPTTFKDGTECVVARGVWVDPYTGKRFTDPRELDIDHMVPLKNAHDSGGWAWSKERRREYANYLAYERHLLAVSASENRKKGEKGPDRYMPPNNAHHCEYVRTWNRIKEDWQLEMTDAEAQKVQTVLDVCAGRKPRPPGQ